MDSAILREHATAFLERMQRHGGGNVRLGPGFRATKNGTTVEPGPDLWKLVDEFLGMQVFTDPEQGQVVKLGVAVVDGERHPFAVRLRIHGDAISEAELIVSNARKGYFCDVDQLVRPDVLYAAPVPVDRASDRDGLRRIAGSYWTGLQESDGSLVPVGYRCDRYGNGKKITNNLEILLSPDAAVHTVASCLNHTRSARPIVRGRRFPVLDVARGVAVSFAVVDFHPAPSGARPDNGSFCMAALFKIVDSEIRILDQFYDILPLGAPSGWDDLPEERE
ncbi:hypothetical protein ACQEVB_37075 [Pseudonocardia sp. CA-107938]|uniref:hypothetical protein n=1 Tax=Pseudonocardia sp. CA-107938 TaxID=3240021 RepID=UPI003D8BD2FC